MTLFLWRKSFEIGVPEIDMQHRRLVGMINELSDAMLEQHGYRTVPHILAELSDYVQLHFSDEERYMDEINYPDLAEHRNEHFAFAQKVITFRDQYSKGDKLDMRELLGFLCSWLKEHIMQRDKAIEKHLRRVEMGLA